MISSTSLIDNKLYVGTDDANLYVITQNSTEKYPFVHPEQIVMDVLKHNKNILLGMYSGEIVRFETNHSYELQWLLTANYDYIVHSTIFWLNLLLIVVELGSLLRKKQ